MNRRETEYERAFGAADRQRDAERDGAGRARDGNAQAYDSGRVLWTAPRGEGERIRLSIKTYQGKNFLDVRIEWRGPDGWLPTKKGVSIRIAEIGDVSAALDRAVEELASKGGAT